MRYAYSSLALIMIGLVGFAIIMVFNDVTVNNEADYYTLKEAMEASMLEAVDVTCYRLAKSDGGCGGEIKISKETDNLMKDKDAFWMLFKIAYHTKTSDTFTIPDLQIGEALITAEIVDMSQQTFRTTKKKLAKWGFAEFRSTTRGTIAKMVTDKFITRVS